MANDKRILAEKRGHFSETLAAWVLRFKGWRICARRFKTRVGEVDLIARKGDLILMVEVKARASLIEAMDAISTAAQRRIEAAGDIWLSRQPDYSRLSVRYDLIAVLPGRWPVHIENIFEGSGR